LNRQQQIKVPDLGTTDPTGRQVSAEKLLRAVHYLSPECIRDQAMDGRSDQFSLAVLAHRMLTGELPFPGTPLGVMFRIAYQGLERDAIRELPPAAQTVFQRSLSKSPSERYATCCEMVDKLENALIRRPVAATRLADASQFAAPPAPAAAPAGPSWAARHLSGEAVKYFGITFVVVALILAGVFYLLLPKPPRPVPVVAAPAAEPVAPPAAHPPAAQPAPAAKAPPKGKGIAKKKAEPEVELKPVEPKIIRE
jgi:serine/threonine-protein kinase